MEFLSRPYMMAFWFGAFSAASLPLGALIGIWLKPRMRIIAAVMAFGAGSLLAALAFELVGPAMHRSGFPPLAIGFVSGCLVFVLMNQALNNTGAFRRKYSTAIAHLKIKKRQRVNQLISKLSRVSLFRSLPAEDVQEIIPHIEDRSFPAGSVIFDQDNFGDALYIIESGTVRIETSGKQNKREVATLGAGQTFGEMALLWNAPRSASAVAETDVKTWQIHKEDFDELLEASPGLRAAVTELAEHRKRTGELPEATQSEESWARTATNSINEEDLRPTTVELKQAVKEGGGNAALAIWLGIFLDGIPESLVIGASMIKAAISPALIGGLFLANLPESMSSATIMKRQGAKTSGIIWMWISLMVMTGVGALLGNMYFQSLSPATHSIFEGLAAGSMLAMIAQTMLPEAYEHGGGVVGIMTVLGFLSAIFIHSLQLAPH